MVFWISKLLEGYSATTLPASRSTGKCIVSFNTEFASDESFTHPQLDSHYYRASPHASHLCQHQRRVV